MPKFNARDVPEVTFSINQVQRKWLDAAIVLSSTWHGHIGQGGLRCVPLEVGEWLSYRARVNLKGPGRNCVRYSNACRSRVFDWYNVKGLGPPAAGTCAWHDWDGIPDDDRFREPVRHAMAWAISDGGVLYVLDTSFDVAYPPESLSGVWEWSAI